MLLAVRHARNRSGIARPLWFRTCQPARTAKTNSLQRLAELLGSTRPRRETRFAEVEVAGFCGLMRRLTCKARAAESYSGGISPGSVRLAVLPYRVLP